jgi:hypothetical protein
VYAGDVIEHFEKERALDFVRKLQSRTKTLVVSIPLGDRWKQGQVLGNEHETHLSQWEEEDFIGWENVIHKNSSGKPIGLFVWRS